MPFLAFHVHDMFSLAVLTQVGRSCVCLFNYMSLRLSSDLVSIFAPEKDNLVRYLNLKADAAVPSDVFSCCSKAGRSSGHKKAAIVMTEQ